jgi:hypothetical protein
MPLVYSKAITSEEVERIVNRRLRLQSLLPM